MSQSDAVDPMDSEHLVGKALAADPPLIFSALVLAIGVAIAIKAIVQMRSHPKRTLLKPWKGFRHA